MQPGLPPPRFTRAARQLLVAATLGIAFHAGAQTATVDLESAWMRPALAGQALARAYVDIKSDTALTLTQASTPVARAVEFVTVAGSSSDAETVVPSVAVAPGIPTRLAFRGNHLRLVDINRDLLNGEQVPVTLRFQDAHDRVISATAIVVVRGFTVPPAEPGPRRP